MLKALDLYCGSGGASKGLDEAGFTPTGIDISPQQSSRYPYTLHIGDATRTLPSFLKTFDLIWASPPCQRFSKMSRCRPGTQEKYPDHIQIIRSLLQKSNKPYVIENVYAAPIRKDLFLCGTMFPHLRVYRHRYFELSHPLRQPKHPKHPSTVKPPDPYWDPPVTEDDYLTVTGNMALTHMCRKAMNIPWMTGRQLREAIPPDYARYIATRFRLEVLKR